MFQRFKIPSNILGIILYEYDLTKGVFIDNPTISISKEIKPIINLFTKVFQK